MKNPYEKPMVIHSEVFEGRASVCSKGDGVPAPREVVSKGYGRVRFGHSELTGFQLWHAACDEEERATRQVLKLS